MPRKLIQGRGEQSTSPSALTDHLIHSLLTGDIMLIACPECPWVCRSCSEVPGFCLGPSRVLLGSCSDWPGAVTWSKQTLNYIRLQLRFCSHCCWLCTCMECMDSPCSGCNEKPGLNRRHVYWESYAFRMCKLSNSVLVYIRWIKSLSLSLVKLPNFWMVGIIRNNSFFFVLFLLLLFFFFLLAFFSFWASDNHGLFGLNFNKD